MDSLLPKRRGVLIALLLIATILISCSTQSPTTVNKITEATPSVGSETDKSDPLLMENKEKELQGKPTEKEENTVSDHKAEEIFDSSKYSDKLNIRFFHTGASIEGSSEGDLILITTPDGANMMIDAGLPECGSILVAFLEKLNVEKLDYAVATHMHIDHIGGYTDVLQNIQVDRMIFPNFINYSSSLVSDLLTTLDAKKIPIELVKAGDSFMLGEHTLIKVLSPEWDITVPEGTIPEKSPGFLNNNALVLRMTYKNNSFLFPADIYWERENMLVKDQTEELKVDVLKAPHHGSNTSSSIGFIDAVDPEIVIMSSNSPSKEVYDRYKESGSDIYITGLDGNILVLGDGDNIEVIQEHERTIKGYYE